MLFFSPLITRHFPDDPNSAQYARICIAQTVQHKTWTCEWCAVGGKVSVGASVQPNNWVVTCSTCKDAVCSCRLYTWYCCTKTSSNFSSTWFVRANEMFVSREWELHPHFVYSLEPRRYEIKTRERRREGRRGNVRRGEVRWGQGMRDERRGWEGSETTVFILWFSPFRISCEGDGLGTSLPSPLDMFSFDSRTSRSRWLLHLVYEYKHPGEIQWDWGIICLMYWLGLG